MSVKIKTLINTPHSIPKLLTLPFKIHINKSPKPKRISKKKKVRILNKRLNTTPPTNPAIMLTYKSSFILLSPPQKTTSVK